MTLATLLFITFAGLALIAAALAFARMSRSWKEASGERVADEDRNRIALEDEKARLLMTLKDLELEHQAGKISDADFQALTARFEREALLVIRRLERTP